MHRENTHVYEAMLSRFAMLCDAPEVPNKAAFMAEYARILRGYSAAELSEATDRVLRTRRYKTWPSIADCVAAAEDVRDVKRQRQPVQPPIDNSMWSEAARAWADDQLRNEDGRIIAEEGWLLGLHEHFCQKYARRDRTWPTAEQMRAMKENARYIDRCASGEIDMGACHSALQKLAKSMQERRKKLADRLFGEVQQ